MECEICEKDTRIKSQPGVIAGSIDIANKRWEIDLIGPMPGGGYILSVIDVFTRFASTRILKDKSSDRVCKALTDVTRDRANPVSIISDNGKEFENAEIKLWCLERGIVLKHGSPYTPTTTGAIERFNQSLIRKLRRITKFGKRNWKECLSLVTNAYNISLNRSIGCAPIELVAGEVKLKIDKEFGAMFKEDLAKITERARKITEKYRKGYEKAEPENYEKFKVGDKVWYRDPGICNSKMSPIWNTKARIKEVYTNAYKLLNIEGKEWVSNQRRVKARISSEGGRVL